MPIARVVLWWATLAALALVARTWLASPVPGPWLVAAFAFLVVLALFGLALPRWEMFAPLLWRGPDGDPRVVLTFDGLPADDDLPAVLERLAAAQIQATFFVGVEQPARAEVLRSLAGAAQQFGQRVGPGVRGWSLLDASRRGLEAALGEHQDRRLDAVRPGTRWLTPSWAHFARRERVTLVGGSVGWPVPLSDARALPALSPGSLICVAAPASLGVLEVLLERAREQRLEWTPLSTWLEAEAS